MFVSLRPKATSFSTFGWPSFKLTACTRGTRWLTCRAASWWRCPTAPRAGWLTGTEIWCLESKVETADSNWASGELCVSCPCPRALLQVWWTWLWLREFLRQPARRWIKRFQPGCSKVTNQTPALKVNTPNPPINVIFGYFLRSHMCDLFLNIEFLFGCTIKIYISSMDWVWRVNSVLKGCNQSVTDTLGTLVMCSSRAEPLSSGPLWAKQLNQEPSDPGGGPGLHQRGLKTHH